jgi:hypothetical protein
MVHSTKNTTSFWHPQRVNFQVKSSHPFGNYPKPQISDLVVLAAYPFGSILSSVSKGEYRYGMNTQEKDNEIYGEGNSYTAEYWQYDARLGRRWNVDPRSVPSFSPYSCFANNPIWFSDVAGDSAVGSSSATKAQVKSGEGPYQFAKRNNISPEQLIKFNKEVFPEGYKKGTFLIHPGQKLNTSDPNQPSSSFTSSSLGKFSTTLNVPQSAFGDHSRISFSSKTKEVSQSGGGENWATATLGFIATDIAILEPTDAALPKWVGYGIAGTAAAAYLHNAGKGNTNYPGPWSYTYQHPSQNPIHNLPKGFDPKETPPDLGTAAKWLIAGRLAYEMYDAHQQQMNKKVVQPYVAPDVVPRDNTNVVQPHFKPYRPRQ